MERWFGRLPTIKDTKELVKKKIQLGYQVSLFILIDLDTNYV